MYFSEDYILVECNYLVQIFAEKFKKYFQVYFVY